MYLRLYKSIRELYLGVSQCLYLYTYTHILKCVCENIMDRRRFTVCPWRQAYCPFHSESSFLSLPCQSFLRLYWYFQFPVEHGNAKQISPSTSFFFFFFFFFLDFFRFQHDPHWFEHQFLLTDFTQEAHYCQTDFYYKINYLNIHSLYIFSFFVNIFFYFNSRK